ncbi:transposase [Roseovarius sp.]|uniref:transposase n=1 Tax=Roseovarius sp. TaxID=1486281 RepID=UPI0035649E72
MDAPVGSWGTQTFIAGLGAGALIAPWVIRGAMDREAFAAYVLQVLAHVPEPGTVTILDNLATQKSAAAAKAMRKAGCGFLFLSPYSPDLLGFRPFRAELVRRTDS